MRLASTSSGVFADGEKRTTLITASIASMLFANFNSRYSFLAVSTEGIGTGSSQENPTFSDSLSYDVSLGNILWTSDHVAFLCWASGVEQTIQ